MNYNLQVRVDGRETHNQNYVEKDEALEFVRLCQVAAKAVGCKIVQVTTTKWLGRNLKDETVAILLTPIPEFQFNDKIIQPV